MSPERRDAIRKAARAEFGTLVMLWLVLLLVATALAEKLISP